MLPANLFCEAIAFILFQLGNVDQFSLEEFPKIFSNTEFKAHKLRYA
jgi:hypothetical protein